MFELLNVMHMTQNGKNALDVAANEQVKLDILIHELRVRRQYAAKGFWQMSLECNLNSLNK